jgi:large subunit ribosomal protein L32e
MSSDYEIVMSKRLEAFKKISTRRKIASLKRKMRKHEFLRWSWWKFTKFENELKWKKPRGKDNPVRLALKGYPPKASISYATPHEIKNMHPCGLKPVIIRCVKDLENLDPEKHVLYIASDLGLKKKLELIRIASSRGFRITNA